MNMLKDVRFEDLNKEQQELAEQIGFETFITLVEQCEGTTLYIPKIESVCRVGRNARIRKEFFNGSKVKHLAIMYSLTEQQIRNIIAKQ